MTGVKSNTKSQNSNSYELFTRAFKSGSVFEDKNDFLDIVYWLRQVFAIIVGLAWGCIPLTGLIAIIVFFITNVCLVYTYATMFQHVDEDEYGGYSEIIKEGLTTAFACFMVSWIVTYDYKYGDYYLACHYCFKINSRINEFSNNTYRRALDGSLCFCTVVLCSQDGLPSEISQNCCSLCACHDKKPCVAIKLYNNVQFKIRLGQAPDLCEINSDVTNKPQLNLRQLIESILCGSQSGDCFNLDIDEINNAGGQNAIVKTYNLILRVDLIQLDPYKNLTCYWNPQIESHWLNRAVGLKERGSYLVRMHSQSNTYLWHSAFLCYSRALQFVSLAYWASKSCHSEASIAQLENNEAVFESNNAASYLDFDNLAGVKQNIACEDNNNYESLQFMLLLNLSLCQLKVGSNDFCVKNCTQAFNLLDMIRDDNVTHSKSSSLIEFGEQMSNDWHISIEDLVKAYFRRAKALKALGQLEEAKSDLESCIQLQQYQLSLGDNCSRNQIENALGASKFLLGKVSQTLADDKVKLITKLKKGTRLL